MFVYSGSNVLEAYGTTLVDSNSITPGSDGHILVTFPYNIKEVSSNL